MVSASSCNAQLLRLHNPCLESDLISLLQIFLFAGLGLALLIDVLGNAKKSKTRGHGNPAGALILDLYCGGIGWMCRRSA